MFLVLLLLVGVAGAQYTPDWDSLDSRPLPSWYDEAKFGIFIHWGVFSVPSWGDDKSGASGEWFWWRWQGQKTPAYMDFMKRNYPPDFTYQDFAAQFKAELYDPDQWADIFKASGAKYIVLTSKHHEGFTNWPSNVSWNWNAMDVGPNRDLVGDLATSIRSRTDIRFGLYHSMFEWFNPLFLLDQANNYKTQKFVFGKTMPELYDIVTKYKPEVIFSDGAWDGTDKYWNSTTFLAWLYNTSPVKDTVAVNDRWGSNCNCKHGGYYTCGDRFDPGTLQKHKWENAMTIDRHSWGYRRNANLSEYLNVSELIQTLVETVSCGGNLLMNVGPTRDGRILPIFEERLRQIGSWLKVNGEAIYSTKPWKHQNDTATPGVWYTQSGGSVYAILLQWPAGGSVVLGSVDPAPQMMITMLGYEGKPLQWMKHGAGGIEVMIPPIPENQLPSQWAWVLKIQNL